MNMRQAVVPNLKRQARRTQIDIPAKTKTGQHCNSAALQLSTAAIEAWETLPTVTIPPSELGPTSRDAQVPY